MKLLSIIVPMYNEEMTVLKVLSALKKVNIRGYKKEVIIIDDGSDDGGGSLVKKFIKKKRLKNFRLKTHNVNLGKGMAVKTGIKMSRGDVIMIQDADLEYSPKDIPSLVKPFFDDRQVQVVYGSRFVKKHKSRYRLFYFGNVLLSRLTNIIYDSNITDMETGYKVFTKDALTSILPLRSKGFGLEPEITAKLLKRGFTIKEVPISYKCRTKEEGKKITWKDGIKAIFYLLKYQFVD